MIEWFKSSYSGGDNDCVEVAHLPVPFRKSSYSAGQSACVEVADTPTRHAVRDSKTLEQPPLAFDRTEWRAFIGVVQDGHR